MRIAVVGAAGQMGKWFTRYLNSKNHQVVVFDNNRKSCKKLAQTLQVEFSGELKKAVHNAELVVVSVPMDVTPKVLKTIGPLSSEGTVIVEISSVKSRIISILRDISKTRNIIPVSIHTLFGPGTRKLDGKRVAIIPVMDAVVEMKHIRNLLPEADLIQVGVNRHDEAMGIILSLTYFMNIVFSAVVSKHDISDLKKLAGPTFSFQLMLAESIFHDDPDLITSIQLNRIQTHVTGT